MSLTIDDYDKVLYDTPDFEVRIINEHVTLENSEEYLPNYNYAIFHKEHGTIEMVRQRYVDVLSAVEQMQYILNTEAYRINRPEPSNPSGGGSSGGGSNIHLLQ